MSDTQTLRVGTIVWRDLTVDNADEIRNFYSQVIGWETQPHDMGEYNDYNVLAPETGEVVAGICNARGSNANIPAQWLIYVAVRDVEESARRCIELGGKVVDGPREMGHSRFCVVQDPAGAVLGLIGTGEEQG